jgi:hypothetical protein
VQEVRRGLRRRPVGAHPLTKESVLSRCVRREDRTRCRDVTVDKPQRPERPVIRKEALAATQNDRVDHQPELIDQVLRD